MEEVNLHPIYRLLKVDYADLLELAEQKGQTILLPDLRKLDNFKLTRSFIKSHLIQENGEAQQNDVWVHIEKDTVTLVDCPNYYPSYRQGLYKANIQRTVIRTNSRFIQFKILLIDRPILPFSMGNITGRNNILNRRRYGGGGGGGMDRRKRLQRQTSVDYGLLHPILIDLESELEDENSLLTSTTCLSSTVDQTAGSDWMEQGSGRAVGLGSSGRIGLGSGSRIELGAGSRIDSGSESRAGSGSRSRVDSGSGSIIGSGNGSRIDSVTGSRIGSGSSGSRIGSGTGGSRIGSGSSGSKIILGCRTRSGSRSDGFRIGSGYVNRIDSGSGIKIDSGTGSRTESRSGVIRVESGSGFGSASAWKKSTSPPPRQSSEDSGIEPDSDDLFFLIPQITSYSESESFILSQTTSSQFITHLRRSIVPLRKYIGEVSSSGSWDGSEINHLSLKVQRFCQDALISFPKSLAVSGRSPRFHETLKISVENIVLIFLHDLLWALVCSIHRDQDTRIHSLLTSLYRQGLGGRGRAGRGLELREELCVPLPAALVELSALDQANTPLDRLTVIHDTVNQLHAHIREYLEKTNPNKGYLSYPSQQEETVLLSTLIIQSRLRHICSTIFYIKHFGFSSPSALVDSFQTFQWSLEYLEKLDNRIKPTQPPGLKLEDLIRIADRLERRNSEELEILTNPVQELYFRDLIQRLELCSMELTKTQEEHWTRLGREVSETDEEGRKEDRSLLSLLHQKLLCNKTILENG